MNRPACFQPRQRSKASLVATVLLACVFVLGGCAPVLVWYGRSPNRRHRVEVEEVFGQQRVRGPFGLGPKFDAIAIETVSIGENGRDLVYAAERGGRWHISINDKLSVPHRGIGFVKRQKEGRVLYAAEDKDGWRVYDDGRAGPRVDAILDNTLTLSSTGQLAYVAQLGNNKVVITGQQQGPFFDGIAALTLAGARVAYIGRRGYQGRVVVDGKVGAAYDGIGELAVTPFRVAYAALREPNWVAVVDGQPEGAYQRVDGVRISEQGEVAYVAKQDDAQFVVQAGRRGPKYHRIRPNSLRYAPNGQLSYAASDGRGWRIVFRGIEGPRYDQVGAAVFARNANGWGYLAKNTGREYVVINGEASIGYRRASNLVLSEDGTRYAYFARRGAFEMVVHSNGRKAVDRAVEGSLVFDESSRHWACLVGVRNARRFYLMLDGRLHKPFDMEEVAAALAALPQQKRADNGVPLRDWIAAELALALHQQAQAGGATRDTDAR